MPSVRTKFEIGEEFGTAKKNLPPVQIVLIGVAIILVAAGILAFVGHKPTAAGSIDAVVAAEIPGQNAVMVAINLSIENLDKQALKIHNIKVEMTPQPQAGSAGDPLSDEPASAVDLDRYFQALPELKKRALDPLPGDTSIPPNGTVRGTIVVSFPVTPDQFEHRKSLKVTVWPYASTVPLQLVK